MEACPEDKQSECLLAMSLPRVCFSFFFFFDGSDKTSKVRSYDTSKILLIDSNDHAL